MKKHEVYVEVESKEQAEIYRKVLEAVGELFDSSLRYYSHSTSLSFDLSDKDWFYSSIKSIEQEKTKITFGELIDLLQRKPLLISEDGVELFEGDKLFEVSFEESKSNPYLVNADGGVGYWTLDDSNNKARWMLQESHEYHSKAFSTKQAAIEWIEAQKPKEKNVKINDDVVATVYKEGWAKFSVPVFRLSENQIKRVLNTMEEIQNA